MTVLYDVALPQVNVLGSTMAYREARDPEAPVALFLHGNPTSSYMSHGPQPGADHVAVARLLLAAGSPREWMPPEKAPDPERTQEQLIELCRAAEA